MDISALRSKLDEKQLTIVQIELLQQKKNTLVAYVLLFLLSGLGVHKLYLRRYSGAFIYVILTILVFASAYVYNYATLAGDPDVDSYLWTFGATSILLSLYWFYDILTLWKQTSNTNLQIEAGLIGDMLKMDMNNEQSKE